MEAKIRRILVAVDFSAAGANAVETAQAYAVRFGAGLTLVHVLHLTDNLFGTGTFAFPDSARQIAEAARVELDKVAGGIRAAGLDCRTDVLHGTPDEQLRLFALDPVHQIDLLVVGTHGRTGLARVAFGSVAQRILQSSPCPVLVVPSRPTPAAT